MDEMLRLSSGLPEVEVPAGYEVVREGEVTQGIWILLSGELVVRKGPTEVNRIGRPGAVIGEVGVLLGAAASATVEASEPSLLRRAADGPGFLRSNPAVTHMVAVGLAERLNYVTTYLVDLKDQYGEAPGLAMVPEVLRSLTDRQAPPATPGSRRDPHPEY